MNNAEVRESALLNEKYYYIRHKSGLDIYVFPKEMGTYYALFGTKYGSVDNKFRVGLDGDYTEVPDGIAHFLEHKMFENENGEDTFLRYARTGANANAYTSFLTTAYLFSCTSNFYESLSILLDFVTSPYFTPETVQKEQGIIGQEIRMGEDNPGRRLLFDMLKNMYEKHNVRIEVAGTVESISQITAELLYKCYNTFYNLNNMALCVVGKVDADKVLEVADKILKEAPAVIIDSVYDKEKPEVFREFSEVKMQVSKPLFSIGIKDTEISSDPVARMKKNAEMAILTDMLFGRSGTLYNELYEDGLISPSFGAWTEHNRSFSFVSVSGDSDDPKQVYDRIVAYTEKCKEGGGLKESDFERCRKAMYANLVKSFDSTEEIANNLLTTYAFDGGEMFAYVDIVRALEFNDIKELMNRLFDRSHFAMAVVNPL